MARELSHRRHPSNDSVAGPQRFWCRTLGGLALYADPTDARPLMEAGKPLAILAYLALAPQGKASRDHVAELLWAGGPLPEARHSLRQMLYRLRERIAGDGQLDQPPTEGGP